MSQPDFHSSTKLQLNTIDQEFYGQCSVCKAWKLVDAFFDRGMPHKSCQGCRKKSKINYKRVDSSDDRMVMCECGAIHGVVTLNRHRKTNRHLTIMKWKENQSNNLIK